MPGFNEKDHLAWCRFMLANIAVIAAADTGDSTASPFVGRARERLSRVWAGLGAQGVEGAMLSMTLTLESFGCRVISSQTSPESGEIIVEPFPGTGMFDGLTDRFDIGLDRESWLDLLQADEESAGRIYDILGAIADGAEVEFIRERTDDGNVRLLLRAW